MAIGAIDGEAEFHASSGLPPNFPPEERFNYSQGWDQSGSLRPPKTHKIVWPWCKFEKTMIVQVRRLDSWIRENDLHQIDLIWADTQGAEGELIAGAVEALIKTRFFYTEYSNDEWYEGQPNLTQIANMLPNFSIVHRFTMDVLFKNTTM
jgi:2-O-methyltransferase